MHDPKPHTQNKKEQNVEKEERENGIGWMPSSPFRDISSWTRMRTRAPVTLTHTTPKTKNQKKQKPKPRRRKTPTFPYSSSNPLHLPITRRSEGPLEEFDHVRRDQASGTNRHHAPGKAPTPNIREVEISTEEGDANNIREGGADQRKRHEPMPGDDFEGDHDELVDDEDGEADAHHGGGVDAADEDLGEALDDGALVDADEDPFGEGAVAEGGAGGEFLVEFWVEVCEGFVDVAVEDEAEDGEGGVYRGVADEEPVAVERVGLELRGDAVHGLADGDDQAAVDDELGQLGAALVRVAPVPDEEFGQVVELRDAEVGGERGLAAFFSDDADPNVRGLDHGDVVATIADAGDPLTCVVANEGCHVGLLRRRTATGYDGWKLHGERYEIFLVMGQEIRKRGAIDKQR